MNKLAFSVLFVAAVAAANASIVYTDIAGTVAFNTGETGNFSVTYLGAGSESITFNAANPPAIVANPGSRTSATAAFRYTATSTTPLASLSTVFSSAVYNRGRVNYSFTVFDADTNAVLAASAPGSVLGANLGGTNGGATPETFLNLSTPTSRIRVEGNYELLASNGVVPEAGFAALGFVEFNHTPVPEPASLAALAVGGMALLRRRRAR